MDFRPLIINGQDILWWEGLSFRSKFRPTNDNKIANFWNEEVRKSGITVLFEYNWDGDYYVLSCGEDISRIQTFVTEFIRKCYSFKVVDEEEKRLARLPSYETQQTLLELEREKLKARIIEQRSAERPDDGIRLWSDTEKKYFFADSELGIEIDLEDEDPRCIELKDRLNRAGLFFSLVPFKDDISGRSKRKIMSLDNRVKEIVTTYRNELRSIKRVRFRDL